VAEIAAGRPTAFIFADPYCARVRAQPQPNMLHRALRLPKQLGAIWRHPLNRGHKAAAIRRWARWQVASRLALGPILVPFVGNTRLLAYPGETGITGNIYCGLADYEDMAFTLHLLRSGDRFVDVGANSGAYTVLASGVAGAFTDAFEPVPSTADRLWRNVVMNALENLVTVHRLGIGARPGVLRFSVAEDTLNRVAWEDQHADEFPVETLDRILCKSPTLIKIDVEGFEPEALMGARDVLKSKSLIALIVEINSCYRRYGYGLGDVMGPLSDAGFEPYSYEPRSRFLARLSAPHATSANTIFVRDLPAVEDRLMTAPRVVVGNSVL
jgi:FkbM family methyltransferase